MQASQRAADNHALEYAVRQANALGLPLVVGFGLTADFPEANLRSYVFMLEGLRETQAELRRRKIALVVRRGSPPEVALELAARAALLVTDRGVLRVQKAWREEVARQAPCPVVQVESEVVVPVEVTSAKEEYAARTLRPRLHRHLEEYLQPLAPTRPRHSSLTLGLDSLELSEPEKLARSLGVDTDVPLSPLYRGGAQEANRRLQRFVEQGLAVYETDRNEPWKDATSHLSPHLHFGQISPLRLTLTVLEHCGNPLQVLALLPRREGEGTVPLVAGAVGFLEELLVRRELAWNFTHYNPRYDEYEALPEWARLTLQRHASDRRPYVYSLAQLEQAQTHDPYWNAAMQEMLWTGYMHNYMRMYWGKKILEWTADPAAAYARLLSLNNKYFLDGRDPASFTNVAWCFGKHDRPWQERPVFGTVRYMNAAGLERKFDLGRYLARVAALRPEGA
jgi:deoxyribodipyrimidine photo-lyase